MSFTLKHGGDGSLLGRSKCSCYCFKGINSNAFFLLPDLQELSPPTVNLKKLYDQETLPEEPILIVISPGADPSQELQDLANEAIGHDRYHQVGAVIWQ